MRRARRIRVCSKKPGQNKRPDLVKKVDQIRGRAKFEKLFARIPLSVICDARLRSADKLVYGVMAFFVWQGRTCAESYVDLADMCCLTKATVIESVKSLCKYGHVKRTGDERSVIVFELTSPVFGQKQGKKTEIVRGASGGPRFASVAVEDVA